MKTRVAVLAVVIAATAAVTMAGAEDAPQQAPGATPAFLMSPDRVAALVDAIDRHLDYIPGEVLVKFKAGMGPSQQERALATLRSRPAAADLEWQGPFARVRDASQPDAEALAARLRAQPEVQYAQPNYLSRGASIPNDPGYARQWNFDAIDAPGAWNISDGAASSVIVAVVDSGVTTASRTYALANWNGAAIVNTSVPFTVNPDLSPDRFVAAKDFAFWDGDPVDMHGHGTHISGTIGEDTNNGLAGAGLAFRARIMPVKVCLGYWDTQFLWSGTGKTGFVLPVFGGTVCATDAMANGIRYAADHGANVINFSIGGTSPQPVLLDAIQYAVSKGSFVAIAMGNSFESGNPTFYPAAYASSINGAVSVGAVGRDLGRAYYSSTGTHLEIVAPGGDDRIGGQNGMIWQSVMVQSELDPFLITQPRFDHFEETPFEGTSMATPHVAGVAALVASRGILDPAVIEAILERTARDLGAKGRDSDFGYGVLQARAALFGFGAKR